jgi:hypothetical protein
MKRLSLAPLFLLIASILAPAPVAAQWVTMYGTQVRNAAGGLLTSGQFCVQPVDNNNHPIIANVAAYVTTGTWTSGATVLTIAGNGNNLRDGEPVQGLGIAPGSMVIGSTSTTVTLNIATTASGSGTALVFGGGPVVSGSACTAVTNGAFGTTNSYELNAFSVPDTGMSNPLNLCLRVTITDSKQNGKTLYTAPCVQPSSTASWCSMVSTSNSYQCNYDLYNPALPAQVVQQLGAPGPQGPAGPAGPQGPAGSGSLPTGVSSDGANGLAATGNVTASGIMDKGGALFNVKAYGAKGDGSTNDCTAFTNTIAAQTSAGGGNIFVPKGNYIMGSACHLTITAPGQLSGAGRCGQNFPNCASIITSTDTTGVLFTATGQNFDFENISIQNLATPTAGSAIQVSGTNALGRVSFANISISGFFDNIDHWVGALWTLDRSLLYAPKRYNIDIKNTVVSDYGDWSITNSSLNLQGNPTNTAVADVHAVGSGGGRIENSQIIGDTNAVVAQYGVWEDCPSCTTNGLNLINNSISEFFTGYPVYDNGLNLVELIGNGIATGGSSTLPAVLFNNAAGFFVEGGSMVLNSGQPAVSCTGTCGGLIMPYVKSGITVPNSVPSGVVDYSQMADGGIRLLNAIGNPGTNIAYNLILGAAGASNGIRFDDGTNQGYINAWWANGGMNFTTIRDGSNAFKWCAVGGATCNMSYDTSTSTLKPTNLNVSGTATLNAVSFAANTQQNLNTLGFTAPGASSVSGSVTMNLLSGSVQNFTVTGNITSLAASNVSANQFFYPRICQNATGGFTISSASGQFGQLVRGPYAFAANTCTDYQLLYTGSGGFQVESISFDGPNWYSGIPWSITSGCGSTGTPQGPTVNLPVRGTFTAGQTSCAPVINTGIYSPNKWIGSCVDLTTPADLLTVTATSNTGITCSGTVVSGDVIMIQLQPIYTN